MAGLELTYLIQFFLAMIFIKMCLSGGLILISTLIENFHVDKWVGGVNNFHKKPIVTGSQSRSRHKLRVLGDASTESGRSCGIDA